MKKLLLLSITVLAVTAVVNARGPKEKLSTPVYQDDGNQAEALIVRVGTQPFIKIYTPSLDESTRKLYIRNMSTSNLLHISTVAGSSVSIITPSFPIGVSTSPWNTLILEGNATYYLAFDGPFTSTETLRILRTYNK